MSALIDLRGVSKDAKLTSAFVFDAIFEAGVGLAESSEPEGALEIAIRLLEARRAGQIPTSCNQAVEFLAEECGLYPYITPGSFDHITQAVLEAHSVNLRGKYYLHAKQMQVLLWLLGGENVILSAPTSFGKTLLVDAYIARKHPKIVVMILPTIALIDECRRRLLTTFGKGYRVVTTSTEVFDPNAYTIFVLTQERFLQRKDIDEIDFLFVDEFYKLDPDRDDGRFESLNIALHRALPRAAQCFMAGPHIKDVKLAERWRRSFRFVRTDYCTVTVNVLDRSSVKDRFQAFLQDLQSVSGESSLVFTSTPHAAEALMDDLIVAGVTYSTDIGKRLGGWIAENYHSDWSIAKGSANGIAIHHGRLPRSLGQLFVRLFDSREIRLLICTSTLIEGVNTSAANVFIYDKKINYRDDFDFFSFANIRGRVGRMMRHFVGNAFLYHQPPTSIETTIEVPMLSDEEVRSDFLLVSTEREFLSQGARERQDAVIKRAALPGSLLREFGAMGIDLLTTLSERVHDGLDRDRGALIWSGYPDKDQRVMLADFCLLVAHARNEPTGLHTARQVQWAWAQLSKIKTFPAFLRWYARTFERKGIADGIDGAFQFLQACEFSFPRTCAAVEGIVKNRYPGADVSFGHYIGLIENWFRPPWMKQLDEAGVPIPLLERLSKHLRSPSSRDDASAQLLRLGLDNVPGLNDVDRFILQQTLGMR